MQSRTLLGEPKRIVSAMIGTMLSPAIFGGLARSKKTNSEATAVKPDHAKAVQYVFDLPANPVTLTARRTAIQGFPYLRAGISPGMPPRPL